MSHEPEVTGAPPSGNRAFRYLVRGRYLVLLVWGTAFFAQQFQRTGNGLTDWRAFEGGARVLIYFHHRYGYSGGALHLYENYPFIQIGPPALLPLTPLQGFRPLSVALAFGILMSLAGLLVVGLCEAIARRVRPADPRIGLWALVGGLAVTATWSHDVGLYRHLDDTMAITMACAAALVVTRQGRWWWVAILLGTACATKPWAVVLIPLLLGLPRLVWARTFIALAAVATAWWLPFLIGAPGTVDALAGYHLVPSAGSVPFLLGVHTSVSSWLRPAQAIFGLAAGVAAVTRGRWLAVPLAGLGVRVALDPYSFSYYGMGPMAAALLWDLGGARRRWPVWTTATLVTEYLVPLVAPSGVAAAGRLLWSGAAVGLLVMRTRKEQAS